MWYNKPKVRKFVSNKLAVFPIFVHMIMMMLFIMCINIILVESQVRERPNTLNGDPVWSPDGSQLAFASTRSGTFDVWLYDFGDDTISRLTSNAETDESPGAWLPDNETIVYVSIGADDSDIYTVNTRTHVLENLTKTPSVSEFAPVVSHDGRYVAFSSRASQRQDIVVMDLQTGVLTNLTQQQEMWFGSADWSKQDHRLVFTDGVGNLWMSELMPNTLQQITTSRIYTAPVWSPTDPIVAIGLTIDDNWEVWLYDFTSGQLTDLTAQGVVIAGWQSWSWDGSRLAYAASYHDGEQRQRDIWVADLQTGEKRRVTHNEIFEMQVAWSPVDDRIVFVSLAEDIGNIWVINADGTGVRQLTGK